MAASCILRCWVLLCAVLQCCVRYVRSMLLLYSLQQRCSSGVFELCFDAAVRVMLPAADPCVVCTGARAGEWNKADSRSREWQDPQIFDPKLTATGQEQARRLRGKLEQLIAQHGPPLWVTSPLTRCIQTMLGACPCAAYLGGPPSPCGSGKENAAPSTSAAAAAAAGTSSAAGDGPSTSKPSGAASAARHSVAFLASIAEHCHTTGDVGRPGAALAADFPQFADQLAGLPDVWWYTEPGKPNCALSRAFNARETTDQMKRRINEFKRWLYSRPEKFIVCVGHSTYWKYFTESKSRMANGEMLTMNF